MVNSVAVKTNVLNVKTNVFIPRHSCVSQVKTHLLLFLLPLPAGVSHMFSYLCLTHSTSVSEVLSLYVIFRFIYKSAGVDSLSGATLKHTNVYNAMMSLHDHTAESVNEEASLCVYNVGDKINKWK